MIKEDTTLVSKHQLLDYVSKRDFNDFTADTRDFQEVTGVRFDAIDKRFDAVDARFDAVDEHFDTIDKRLNSVDKQLITLNRKFDELKEDMRVQNGALLDQFKENMKITLEYVQNIEATKVDEKRFEELKEKVENYLRTKDLRFLK